MMIRSRCFRIEIDQIFKNIMDLLTPNMSAIDVWFVVGGFPRVFHVNRPILGMAFIPRHGRLEKTQSSSQFYLLATQSKLDLLVTSKNSEWGV